MADRKHLEDRNGWYWVQVTVPKAAQPHIGKKVLRANLKTQELRRANEEKGEHITRFRRDIRAALKKAGKPDSGTMPDHIAKGLAVRPIGYSEDMLLDKAINEIPTDPNREAEFAAFKFPGVGTALKRLEYVEAALGKATPISPMLDDFIKSYRGRAARTVEARRKAVESFVKWLRQEKVLPNFEEVTRRVASRYKEHMVNRGDARDTINKALGGLRLYWRWMVDSGNLKDSPNPWDRQSVAKIETGDDDEPEINAYTDSEIIALFSHVDAAEFRDAMMLAALSGLRRGELFALTVEDTADGFLRVQKGKTKSARRLVPIHSTLRPIVARLCEGKEPGDLLLADRTQVRKQSASRVIGDAFGKRFGRFRATALPDSTTTNFHSFRHYFGTKLRLAGTSESTVALLMGHANKSITFGRYAKLRGTNLTAEQLQELREFLTPAVEAIKLPTAKVTAESKDT